jgi:hypothetical protein
MKKMGRKDGSIFVWLVKLKAGSNTGDQPKSFLFLSPFGSNSVIVTRYPV